MMRSPLTTETLANNRPIGSFAHLSRAAMVWSGSDQKVATLGRVPSRADAQEMPFPPAALDHCKRDPPLQLASRAQSERWQQPPPATMVPELHHGLAALCTRDFELISTDGETHAHL